ncbi:MAG TPA: YncE family protein [Bryobacteraceae bacterium]|jgi:hypothetical protein|nr:YncE family protein [Bryobacteraceae bacterium]
MAKAPWDIASFGRSLLEFGLRLALVAGTLAFLGANAAQAQSTAAYIVSDQADNNVRVYSVASNQLLETLHAGATPVQALVSPNGRIAFIANVNSGYLSVLDFTIGAEIQRIHGLRGGPAALSPDGTRLVAATENPDELAILNTGNFAVVNIPLGGLVCDNSTPPNCPAAGLGLSGIAITGNTAFVANTSGLQIAAINLNTHSVVTIPGTSSAGAIVASPDGRYAIEGEGASLVVIDSTTNTIAQRLDTSNLITTSSIVITPPPAAAGTFVFVSGSGSDGNPAVQAFSFASGLLAATPASAVDLQFFPNALSLSPDGTRLYAAQQGPNTVEVFDASQASASLPVISNLTVGLAVQAIGAGNIATQAPATAPILNASTPQFVVNNDTAANRAVTISGANFGPDAQVRFGNLDPVTPSSNSTSALQATLPFQAAAQAGNVIVTNPSATGPVSAQFQSGILSGKFTIGSPATFQPVNQVLVVNDGDGTLASLNVSTNSDVAKPVPGFLTASGLVITPDGSRAYTLGFFTDTLYVYDAVHAVQTAAIPLPNASAILIPGQQDPLALVNSPLNSGRAAVYLVAAVRNFAFNNNDVDELLYVVDADPTSATYNTVVAQLHAGLHLPFSLSGAMAASADGRYIYTNTADFSTGLAFSTPSGNLIIFDAVTQTATAVSCPSLGIAGYQGHIEISPDGSTLILRTASGALGIFDISANPLSPKLLATVNGTTLAGFNPPNFLSFRYAKSAPNLLIGFDSTQNIVEAVNVQRSGTTVNSAVLGSLAIPGIPAPTDFGDFDLTADGKLIYVLLSQEDDVAVVDGVKLQSNDPSALITKILTGQVPTAAAVRPGTPTPASTPANPIVVVQPVSNVAISFADSSGGTTTVATTNTTPVAAPAGFQVGAIPIYYEVSTTASFSTAEVCFQYDPAAVPSPEGSLRLAHYDASIDPATGQPTGWVDVTLPNNPNTATHTICGQVSSFSPFVIGIASPTFLFDSLLIDISNLSPSITPRNAMRDLRRDVLQARAFADKQHLKQVESSLEEFIGDVQKDSGTLLSADDAARLISEANALLAIE